MAERQSTRHCVKRTDTDLEKANALLSCALAGLGGVRVLSFFLLPRLRPSVASDSCDRRSLQPPLASSAEWPFETVAPPRMPNFTARNPPTDPLAVREFFKAPPCRPQGQLGLSPGRRPVRVRHRERLASTATDSGYHAAPDSAPLDQAIGSAGAVASQGACHRGAGSSSSRLRAPHESCARYPPFYP